MNTVGHTRVPGPRRAMLASCFVLSALSASGLDAQGFAPEILQTPGAGDDGASTAATPSRAGIFNPFVVTGGLALVVSPQGGEGSPIQRGDWQGLRHQTWHLTNWNPNGSWYSLRNELSGKCMDIRGPSRDNYAVIHQWTCYGPYPGTVNQRWQLRYTGVRHQPTNRYLYQWVNGYSGKCLDMVNTINAIQLPCVTPLVGPPGQRSLNPAARSQAFYLIPN